MRTIHRPKACDRKKSAITVLLCISLICHSQSTTFHPQKTRILFLLDASGSMKEAWNGTTRFDAARALLYKLVDSIERKEIQVEFAVRVFGAQYPRAQKNCKDSRLYAPFAKKNSVNFKNVLSKLIPQGMTPLAYSIVEGAHDFTTDTNSINAIILITDGNEICDGNPCDAAKLLAEKRIALKPFIVGVDVAAKDEARFDCVGTFLNTRTSTELQRTVGVLIRQTLNNTSAQINLIDANGNAAVTNIAFTLYDHFSRKPLYSFIHAMRTGNLPDTLFLNPVGVYDLEVHSSPPLRKDSIELTVGRHNIIALDVPLGGFQVNTALPSPQKNDVAVIIRNRKKIVNVQARNETKEYLRGAYDVQVLTTPFSDDTVLVLPFSTNEKTVASYGTLLLTAKEKMRGSMLLESKTERAILRFEISSTQKILKLQPGDYVLLCQPQTATRSESTQTKHVKIEEGKTIVFDL